MFSHLTRMQELNRLPLQILEGPQILLARLEDHIY